MSLVDYRNINILFSSNSSAQIQAKGNNIIEATIKIVKNGSYSFNLSETVLKVTVYVVACEKCQQAEALPPHMAAPEHDNIIMPQETAMSGEGVQMFHHKSTSPTAVEQVCEGYGIYRSVIGFITLQLISYSLDNTSQGCIQ